MDYMLQAHGEKFVCPVPKGLHELMSDIAREVLREQPPCLYAFIVAYLETLIQVKETTKYAADTVDKALDASQNLLQYVKCLGVSWEEANMAATMIQAAYRSYRTRIYLKELRESEQKEEYLQKIMASHISYFHERGITIEMAEEAATKIQAYYRGYTVRKQGIQAMLRRRDTVDHLGPLLKTCRSEMLRAEAQRRHEFKLLYQENSQVTIGTTLSKLALEARMQKQHSYGLIYQQQPSPISIPSSLFPGSKMTGDYDMELAEISPTVVTPSGNLMKLDSGSENMSVHSCGSAELKNVWLKALEFPNVPPMSYEEVTQDRNPDVSDLKSVKSRVSSKEHVPAYDGGASPIEIYIEGKLSLKDEDTSKKSTRSASSVKSGQSQKTIKEKPSKASSGKRTSSQKSVISARSKSVASKTQSTSSQTKSEQKITENQNSSVSIKSATSEKITDESAEKKSQLIENETKLELVASKTSDAIEKKTSSKSTTSDNRKEQTESVKETTSDKLQTDMSPDISEETAGGN